MANENILMHIGMDSMLRFLTWNEADFIEQIWGGTHLQQHFEDKLKGLVAQDKSMYRSYNVMVRFIGELDNTNLELLYDYIIKTHSK